MSLLSQDFAVNCLEKLMLKKQTISEYLYLLLNIYFLKKYAQNRKIVLKNIPIKPQHTNLVTF